MIGTPAQPLGHLFSDLFHFLTFAGQRLFLSAEGDSGQNHVHSRIVPARPHAARGVASPHSARCGR